LEKNWKFKFKTQNSFNIYFYASHYENFVEAQKKSGLPGAEEVEEAEDYEAPGSNPGKEL
jgi:hypothetical protein